MEILGGYMVGDHLDKLGDLNWRSLGYLSQDSKEI